MTKISTKTSDFGSTVERIGNVTSAYMGQLHNMKKSEKKGDIWQEEFLNVFRDLEKFGWLAKPNKHWNDIRGYLLANLADDAEEYPALALMAFAFNEVLKVYTPKGENQHILQVEYTVDGDAKNKKTRQVLVDTHVKLMSKIEYIDKKGKWKSVERDLTDTHPEDLKGNVIELFSLEGYEWGHYNTEYMTALFMGLPAMLRMYEEIQKLVRRSEKMEDNLLVQDFHKGEGTLEKLKKGKDGEFWARNDRDFKQSVRKVTELMFKGKALQFKRHMSELCLGTLLSEKLPEGNPGQSLKAMKEQAVLGLNEITGRRSIDSCKELEGNPKVKALLTWFNTNPECRNWEEGVKLASGCDPEKDADIPSGVFAAIAKQIWQERHNVWEGRAYNDNGATVDPDSEQGKKLAGRKANRADRKARKEAVRKQRAVDLKILAETVSLM